MDSFNSDLHTSQVTGGSEWVFLSVPRCLELGGSRTRSSLSTPVSFESRGSLTSPSPGWVGSFSPTFPRVTGDSRNIYLPLNRVRPFQTSVSCLSCHMFLSHVSVCLTSCTVGDPYTRRITTSLCTFFFLFSRSLHTPIPFSVPGSHPGTERPSVTLYGNLDQGINRQWKCKVY